LNHLFVVWGLSDWKPLLTALLLPPLPWLILGLWGGWLRRHRPWLGAGLGLTAVAGLWLCSTLAAAQWLRNAALQPPPPLTAARLQSLAGQARQGERMAIVVLGGGREQWAPEYQGPSLDADSLERLRYGLWLGGQTGVPVAFSGGVGWGQQGSGAPEAQIAAQLARDDFHQPLRWVEATSRDTHENAQNSWALLQRDGVQRIVLVTHGWHMTRALRDFRRALAARTGAGSDPGGPVAGPDAVIAAPIGLGPQDMPPLLRWLPSNEGLKLFRQCLREWLGLLAGA
jgi:uncharacterized SAM-binding protein YcdF (DUF218 family)